MIWFTWDKDYFDSYMVGGWVGKVKVGSKVLLYLFRYKISIGIRIVGIKGMG